MLIELLKASLVLGIIGLIFGIILSVISKRLEVLHSQKVEEILKTLPGVNCTGCGHLSCYHYASAVAEKNDEDGRCTIQ